MKSLEDLREVVFNIIGLCPHDWSMDLIEWAINEAVRDWRDREEDKVCH